MRQAERKQIEEIKSYAYESYDMVLEALKGRNTALAIGVSAESLRKIEKKLRQLIADDRAKPLKGKSGE